MNYRTFDLIGSLDLLIYVILDRLDLNPERFVATDVKTIDAIALANATKFVNAFPRTPIKAIKEIKEASGWNLRSSKEAWETILETYELGEVHFRNCAKVALEAGQYDAAEYYLGQAKRYALYTV